MVLVVYLAALLLTGFFALPAVRVFNNLKARWYPQHEYDSRQNIVAGTELLGRQDVDLVIEVEQQRLRVYRLDVRYETQKDQYKVQVYTVRYAQNPLQISSLGPVLLEGEYMGGGHGPLGVAYYNHVAYIPWGKESVTLTISRIGADIEVEIPIDWEVIP